VSETPIERMRKLVEAKKQQNAGRTNVLRPEKNMQTTYRAAKQHKKGGLFDGK
jgi:hypothetical protein